MSEARESLIAARRSRLPAKRSRIVTLARRWAETGGLGWSDEEWEAELAKLRKALSEYDEALNV